MVGVRPSSPMIWGLVAMCHPATSLGTIGSATAGGNPVFWPSNECAFTPRGRVLITNRMMCHLRHPNAYACLHVRLDRLSTHERPSLDLHHLHGAAHQNWLPPTQKLLQSRPWLLICPKFVNLPKIALPKPSDSFLERSQLSSRPWGSFGELIPSS